MSSGLYGNIEVIERYVGTYNGTTNAFVAPCDLDIVGGILYTGTALTATQTAYVNIAVTPTTQVAATGGGVVGASNGVLNNVGQTGTTYNLWSTANRPTVVGATGGVTTNLVNANAYLTKAGQGYPQNYPFPGPAGTVGYTTAQSTTSTTSNPKVTATTFVDFGIATLVAPDTTYFGVNDLVTYGGTGYASQPANIVHAGDILSFAFNGSGTATTVEFVLLANKN